MTNTVSTRDVSFDAFRGICIIAVIGIHAATSAWPWYGSPSGAWNYYTILLTKQLYVFAVPSFFFMSGYFSSSKMAMGIRQSINKIGLKLRRILIPYFVWSLFSAFFLKQNFKIIELFKNLLMGKEQGPYYFLIVLTIFIVLTPLLRKLMHKKYGLYFIFTVNVVTLVLIYHFRFILTEDFSWYYAAIPFTTWIFFYYLGLTMRYEKRDYVLPLINTEKKALLFMILSFILCLFEVILITLIYGKNAGGESEVRLSAFLFSTSVIAYFFFVRYKLEKWPKFLIYIGEYSFGIYLIHEFFRVRISSFWSGFPVLLSIQPLFQLVVVGSTLLACIGTIYVLRKILGSRISATYLGF